MKQISLESRYSVTQRRA